MGCSNFICENYKVDGQKVVLSTIVNVFFRWQTEDIHSISKLATLMYIKLPSP